MRVNIIRAMYNFCKRPTTTLSYRRSTTRYTCLGAPLEFFAKDFFCSSFYAPLKKRDKLYQRHFSYIGDEGHPPDFMLKGGDAVEVKQIKDNSMISLNGCCPMALLCSNNRMLTKKCRTCEPWNTKRLLYFIGITRKKRLRGIWCISSSCFAAEEKIFKKHISTVRKAIACANGIVLSKTNEIAKIKEIDPLSITQLRICARWSIYNPKIIFKNFETIAKTSKFFFRTVMLEKEYMTYPKADRKNLERSVNANFSINEQKIRSPNKPKKLLKAMQIKYEK